MTEGEQLVAKASVEALTYPFSHGLPGAVGRSNTHRSDPVSAEIGTVLADNAGHEGCSSNRCGLRFADHVKWAHS